MCNLHNNNFSLVSGYLFGTRKVTAAISDRKVTVAFSFSLRKIQNENWGSSLWIAALFLLYLFPNPGTKRNILTNGAFPC